MNIKRIDINQHDVFISWTSADRELKDKIVEYLRKNQISCLESDHQCSGDYRQWSKEAVGACNIFLPIVSSDTFHSKYVPIEIEEYRKFDNFENRIVPVWTSNDVFDAEPWDITRYGSSVILDEKGLTEAVLKNILDKVISLPWGYCTEENLDIEHAEKVLNDDHFGLADVKERIIEFLAVRKINPDVKGQIICLAGPPGVGKTSIAASIARAMKRKYVRVSLGGVRDEADIRGHRKTYIGSMPGRIVNALVEAKSKNPLMLLDEIDKLTLYI